jgi:LPXTG-motif cell wall-anchored protein
MLSLLLMLVSVLGIPTTASAASLSIAIDKTAYPGHDGGTGCPGDGSIEVAPGADLTFCFVVTNTGSEPLGGAAVGDPALGITSDDMSLLIGDPAAIEPGGSVVWFFETSLASDLVNTATVGAFPLDASGGPSYGDNPVIASDAATVTVGGPSEPPQPGITIDKTVYEGSDGGQSCPGTESVTVAAGTDLTFCFRVTNTGDTYLADVTIDDPVLGITQDQMQIASGSLELMAPGANTDLYYEATAGEMGYVNTASTTGTPSDSEGTEIPSVEPPVDDDEASVDVEGGSELPTAEIEIRKQVYAGHDAGASCPGFESIEVAPSTDVTYCFEVENTGEAYLADVTIEDPTLGITDADMVWVSGDPGLVGPGEVVSWYFETTSGTDDVVNTAITTGTPSEPDGTPLVDVDAPEDDDDATVEVVDQTEATAEIDITKIAYEGHDDGLGCSTDLDGITVSATPGSDITYCFIVANDGEAHLADVTVDDPTLGITDADMVRLSGDPDLLAPGATVIWYFETALGTQDVTNVASTTGTPSRPDGTPIPNIEPPTDEDDAVVEVIGVLDEELEPAIGLDKTVYEGHNGGSGCATAGDEVFADYGTAITYCFEVTNTGTAYLANVTVNDPTLGITSADMTLLSGNPALLASGQTVVWFYETTLDDDLTNVASTSGEPVDETGNPIPASPPSDTDDATVGQESVLQEELPSTGVDADIVAWIGIVLLSGGAVLLGADRRRRAGWNR